MEFKKTILPNGLSIIGEVNKSAKSAAVGFFVRTGARDETKEINGVSHFLEPMLFKGNEKLSALEVNQAFDRTGAQFNAFTSEENTVYYAAVLPESLAEVTRLWTELMRPSLREDDFNIEKNVIKEEIAMYKDLPGFDVLDRCRSLHFDGHPCGNSVLGTEKSIDGLVSGQMRDYFVNRYCPNNMVLVCTGNFDWEQICSIAESSCGNWERKPVERLIRDCRGSGKHQSLKKHSLVRQHICLMSPSPAFQDPRRFAASLLAVIVGDESGSRFFWQLVDKALAEEAHIQFAPMDGTGIFCSYIRCSSENVSRVLDTVNNIFQSLVAEGVSEKELTKARNKLLSAVVIKNELPMGRLVDLGFNWVYSEQYYTIAEEIELIKAVTVDDIAALIHQYNPCDFTQFMMGPGKTT